MKNSFNTFLQRYNLLLHQEPWSSISHCIFWILFWIISAPLMIWSLLVQLVVNLFYHFALGSHTIDPKKNPDVELAVVITGCDTGFGKDLTWEVAREGFVVFAGCLQESSFAQFQSEPRIIPIKMDVTSDADVQHAVDTVNKWLSSKEDFKGNTRSKQHKRYLHAVVNNAGIGTGGLIDWFDMESFEKVMQVNFFGMVRTVKAFYPIFKDQAPKKSTHHYEGARIINMISAAGLNANGIPNCSGYEASKNAAEAFTAGLRLEMKMWNVQVTAVNPTFHATPIVENAGSQLKATWDKLSPELKTDYGIEFFEHTNTYFTEKFMRVVWPPHIVTDEVLKCLKSPHPAAQLLVGMDCRFICVLLRWIPAWARTLLFSTLDFNPVKPAKMKRHGLFQKK